MKFAKVGSRVQSTITELMSLQKALHVPVLFPYGKEELIFFLEFPHYFIWILATVGHRSVWIPLFLVKWNQRLWGLNAGDEKA